MLLLFQGLLWLAAPGAVTEPVAAAPDAEELEASAELFEEITPEKREPDPDVEQDSSDLFRITSTTLFTASGNEPETNLVLDETGWRVEDLLRPRRHRAYPSQAVAMYAEVSPWDWLLFRALLDTREIRAGSTLQPPLEGLAINGNQAEDELGSNAVLRELSVMIAHGAMTVEVGRFLSDVAEGMVYRDYGAGVRVRVDLQEAGQGPFEAEVLLTSVGQRVEELDNNGLAALRLDWNLDLFQHVSLLMAVSEDENGEISEVLRSAYAENLLESQQALNSLFLQDLGSGNVGYLGAMGHFITPNHATIDTRLVLMRGKFDLSVPLEVIATPDDVLEGRDISLDVSGFALDATVRFRLTDELDLAGHAFVLSGDTPPTADGGEYNTFIGLAPYWVWTGLFFSGGINQLFLPSRSASAGINGRGVFGFGPALEARTDDLRGEARTIALSASVDPPGAPVGGDGRGYGVELDLFGEWQATPWLSLGAELDLLLPGKFFPQSEPAYLAITMVTLSNGE
ncbi:MAG: hypothetical protein PVI30_02690 [Myxococcales bacterium]|jgi:hypothetical protein